VLVSAASRHGATREIAVMMARWLPETPAGRSAGLTATFLPVEQHPDPGRFDGVVFGSAVYAGRWLESARHWVTTSAAALRKRPVWLFSSGPIGAPPFPPDEPYDLTALLPLIGARGHSLFPGRLHERLLTFEERAMATAMRAPFGDFRDWDAVHAWSAEIAHHLVDLTSTSGSAPSGTR
jgi:menaquinone-dependent protoporphyrinogen oxidase